MGARKANRAEKLKAEKKQKAIAVMRDCPTSPRKMRLVADIIRGVEINKALGILRYSKKEASIRMEKLLKSAIANWEAKNENERLEDTKLCVKEIFVDGGRMLKRIQAAPQGRAHLVLVSSAVGIPTGSVARISPTSSSRTPRSASI